MDGQRTNLFFGRETLFILRVGNQGKWAELVQTDFGRTYVDMTFVRLHTKISLLSTWTYERPVKVRTSRMQTSLLTIHTYVRPYMVRTFTKINVLLTTWTYERPNKVRTS